MKKKLLLTLLISIVALLLCLGYFFRKNIKNLFSAGNNQPALQENKNIDESQNNQTGWWVYRNSEFGFEMTLPEPDLVARGFPFGIDFGLECLYSRPLYATNRWPDSSVSVQTDLCVYKADKKQPILNQFKNQDSLEQSDILQVMQKVKELYKQEGSQYKQYLFPPISKDSLRIYKTGTLTKLDTFWYEVCIIPNDGPYIFEFVLTLDPDWSGEIARQNIIQSDEAQVILFENIVSSFKLIDAENAEK